MGATLTAIARARPDIAILYHEGCIGTLMKSWILVVALANTGCQFLSEKAVETASGGKLKIDGDKVEITGDNGEKAVMDGKTVVVTGPDGAVAKIETDDKGGGTMKVEGPDGAKAVFGAQELPKNFPLTLVDGAKIATSMVTNDPNSGEVFMVTAMVKAEVAALGDRYEKELKAKNLTVTRTETAMGEGKMLILAGKADKVEAVVQVVKNTGEEDTMLTLSWTTKTK